MLCMTCRYPYTAAYGYQGVYNPQMQQSQYYAQLYGGGSTTSSSMGNPYYYQGGYSRASSNPGAQRIAAGAPYYYYPAQMEGNLTPYSNTPNAAATPFQSAASLPSSSTNNLQPIPPSSGEPEAQQSKSEEPEAQTST
ncbi:hypothetical protein KSS87_020731 [Heliosperma pusillum]|nr:hypothetical protein KSS87_020731 [Heliosperma pusillum]